ncbi:MAG TPA: methionyl-tRNA formyltransferase, partial [Acidimicrobiia bacterium]
QLRDRLTALGTRLLLEHLPRVPETQPAPQEGEPTYAEKLTVNEFRLDPSRPADELARVVRAGNPRPGAWMVVDGKRVKVWRAQPGPGEGQVGVVRRPGDLVTADGILRLEEVQPEGKPRMTGQAWMAGLHERVLPVEAVEAS